MLRKGTWLLIIAGVTVALGQQQPKPSQTILYFTKNDPKYSEVLAALADEPKCATLDVNIHNESARDAKIDATHESWWLLASPKEYSGYKKYRYNYVLEAPGTLTANDLVAVVSDKTSQGLAARVCSQVAGTSRGARIHVK